VSSSDVATVLLADADLQQDCQMNKEIFSARWDKTSLVQPDSSSFHNEIERKCIGGRSQARIKLYISCLYRPLLLKPTPDISAVIAIGRTLMLS